MGIHTNPVYVMTIRSEATGNTPALEVKANMPDTLSFGVASEWESRLPANLFDLANEVVGTVLPPGKRVLDIFSAGAQQLYGINPILQALTHPAWNGTSPLEFNLLMLFDAEYDAAEEVIRPIINLIQMAAPYKGDAEELSNRVNNDVIPNINSRIDSVDELRQDYAAGISLLGGSSPKNLVEQGLQGLAAGYGGASKIIGGQLLFPPGPSALNPERGRISLTMGSLMHIDSIIIPQVNVTLSTRLDIRGLPISGQADVVIRTTQVPSREDIAGYFRILDTAGQSTANTLLPR